MYIYCYYRINYDARMDNDIEFKCFHDKDEMEKYALNKCIEVFSEFNIDVKHVRKDCSLLIDTMNIDKTIYSDITYNSSKQDISEHDRNNFGKDFYSGVTFSGKDCSLDAYTLSGMKFKTVIGINCFSEDVYDYGKFCESNKMLKNKMREYNKYFNSEEIKCEEVKEDDDIYCVVNCTYVLDIDEDSDSFYTLGGICTFKLSDDEYGFFEIIRKSDIYNKIDKLIKYECGYLNIKFTKDIFNTDEKFSTFGRYSGVQFIKLRNYYICHFDSYMQNDNNVTYIICRLDEYNKMVNENRQMKSDIDELKSCITGGDRYKDEKAKFEGSG